MDLQKKVKVRMVKNPFLTIDVPREHVHMFELVDTAQDEIDSVCRMAIRTLGEGENNMSQIFLRDANMKLVDRCMEGRISLDGTPFKVTSKVKDPVRIAGIVTADANTAALLRELFLEEGYKIQEQGKFWYMGWCI